LNRFGGGKITQGLRDLSKISDSIRTGETDAAIIPNSEGYVLDAVGINPNAAQQASDWVPVWYNLADQAIVAVQAFHELSGLELGWSIVSVTVFLRLALFPLMVKTQQTTSRMAHLQPELQLMKQEILNFRNRSTMIKEK